MPQEQEHLEKEAVARVAREVARVNVKELVVFVSVNIVKAHLKLFYTKNVGGEAPTENKNFIVVCFSKRNRSS